MIKAIALDDEPLALNVIENFSAQAGFVQLDKTFTKPVEAVKYLDSFPVDLIFLDIRMPSISGLDLYKSIRQDTMVIFTTAYSEYAVQSYELSAVDYLLKPFTYDRFLQGVGKAREFMDYSRSKEKPGSDFFYVRADYSLIKITYRDILFIEGLDDYVRFHLEGQKPVVARMTMKSVMLKLPAARFHQVHRSFIVPLDRVGHIRKNRIHILDREIPIGLSYKEAFLKLVK
jgi:DNA-binding LytR/AlgR family response regulator